ncbi:MAG: DegT/DnrJ/EryC1/StrS family aminotransferase [Thermoanaerobaculia bacterium]|nr:DegT/DnrJ/EryC1/StrS family aminotransferase [Thermoanaerobaculia bacterium]
MTTQEVRPLDLNPVARRLEEDLLARWRDLLRSTAFIGGPEVTRFEENFARFLDAKGCVGVANGTDAIVVALKALNLQPGDVVLVPAFTFFATAEAVCWAGGVPRIVDVEPATLNINVAEAERLYTPEVRGIIGVHLFGMPCDLRALTDLCDRKGLWLIEDAAQAHGARFEGQRVGTFGDFATWSFYPSKNLGCFGDGGAVTGMDPERLDRLRSLANHGRTAHYQHGEVGTNSRLDALQAAVLNLRLETLEEDNRRRVEIADRYRRQLAGVGDIGFLAVPKGRDSVYHQFTIRSTRRDDLRSFLDQRGIGTGVYYPIPLHLQPALVGIVDDSARPVAERASEDVLSLPIYAELSDDAVDRVCAEIEFFFD